MSWFGKLMGTDAAITSTIGMVKDGLDALVYTDEEKATDAAKERSEARGMVVEWMKATQGQNLARRLIALTLTGIWSVMYLGYFGLAIASIWVDDPARLEQAAELMYKGADQMSGAMMLILGFYFAATHLDKIVGGAMGKFSGQKNTP